MRVGGALCLPSDSDVGGDSVQGAGKLGSSEGGPALQLLRCGGLWRAASRLQALLMDPTVSTQWRGNGRRGAGCELPAVSRRVRHIQVLACQAHCLNILWEKPSLLGTRSMVPDRAAGTHGWQPEPRSRLGRASAGRFLVATGVMHASAQRGIICGSILGPRVPFDGARGVLSSPRQLGPLIAAGAKGVAAQAVLGWSRERPSGTLS